MPKLQLSRLRPRAWRDLFPATPPPRAAWLPLSSAEPDPSPNEFWSQLAKAADPKFERPKALPDIAVEKLPGEQGVILSDAGRGIYVHLAGDDHFLWERLDGTRNQIDLVVDYCLKFKALAPAKVAGLVELVRAEGLLDMPADQLYPKLQDRLVRGTFGGRVSYISQTFLQREIAVSGIDGALGWLYRGGVRLLYTRAVQVVLWLVSLAGLAAFLYLALSRRYSLLGEGSAVEGGLTLFVFTTLALILHEAAHAFTVKAFGRRVRRAGLFILMGLIGAFVDTTDVWPAGKRAQLWVTWAGPFVNLVLGGIASLALIANPDAAYAPLAFQFAVSQYGLVLLNLTPFLRLDGYYLLSDALGVPNLSSRSSGFLRKVFPRRLREAWADGHLWPSFNREEKILLVFGGLSAFWIANLLGLGVLVAPVRMVETVGRLFTGGFAGASPITIIFALVGLVFGMTLVLRTVQGLSGWLRKTLRGLQSAPAWRVALVFGALAIVAAVVPELLVLQGSPRVVQTGRVYAHAIALTASLLAAVTAARLFRELRGAGLRPALGGLALTGLALLVIAGAAAINVPLPLRTLRLLAWVPALLGAALAASALRRLVGAPLGWAVLLAALAAASLAAAPDASADFLTLAGYTLLAAGIWMHWQLAHRPLGLARVAPLVATTEPDQMLKQAVYAVGRELTQSLGEVAGPKAKRDVAFEFNNRLANTEWPIWLTSRGSFGEKFKGPLDVRAQMYREALVELRGLIAARLGGGFTGGAEAQAVAELPLPLRAIFNKWMLAAGGEAESDDDRVRLRLAGRRLAETLVIGCAQVYGWRLTESAIGGFNRAAAGANWPMYLRGNGRLADELTGDLLHLSQTYAEALQALLGRVAAVAGPAFVERGVVQVYDSLPWETREVAAQALFEPLSWARMLQRARTADPRTAFLRSVPLLGWLPPDEAAALAARVKPRHVKAGQVVIERDTYLDQALIVRRGALQAVVVEGGLRRAVEDVGPGGLVGVRSIIANEPSPYRYVAQAEAELWQVPAAYVVERLHPLLQAQDAIDGERARLALLARIPLLAALSGPQRARVARAMETVRLGPDKVVLQAGGESQGFFIVQAGELDVLVAGAAAEGDERRVSSLGPGEFFGEAALLNRTPLTATVRSRTAVELLRLPPAYFYSLLGTGGAVSASLDRVQSRRAKERLRFTLAAAASADA